MSEDYTYKSHGLPYEYMDKYGVVTANKEGGSKLYLICTEKFNNSEKQNLKTYSLKGEEGTDFDFVKNHAVYNQLIKEAKEEAEAETEKEGKAKEEAEAEPLTDREIAEAVKFVEEQVFAAKAQNASDLHFEKYEKYSLIRFRIDGVLNEIKCGPNPKLCKTEDDKSKCCNDKDRSDYLDDKFYNSFDNIARVIMLDSDIDTNSRVPEDGQLVIKGLNSDKKINLRVSVLPTKFGRRVVMRILDDGEQFTIGQLGFGEDEDKVIKAIKSPQGMVLVTGPTGSGKSTTLFAALETINKPDINILTAENPVEFSLDGVGQVNIREDIGLSFSATLRSFLRQDPDVIMVGEIRDKETGNIAIKAALTGHLVLSTLHTNDAVSTVTRLINMGIEPYLITEAVSLVVAQRLARKICKNCKVEDKSVTHAELKSIGLTDKIKLYKGEGCSECGQTGSKGRKGIYEVLELDADFIEGVLGKIPNAELLKIAKGSEFKTMQDNGRKMVTSGEISLKEFNRVLAPE